MLEEGVAVLVWVFRAAEIFHPGTKNIVGFLGFKVVVVRNERKFILKIEDRFSQ